ncbi:hypothetical protein H6B14_15135 [Phocaeicola coprophilus]|nr:hypothetical protein [Phocaeicola coprophilus]
MKTILLLILCMTFYACNDRVKLSPIQQDFYNAIKCYVEKHPEWNTFYIIKQSPLTGKLQYDDGGWLLGAGDSLTYWGRKYKHVGYIQLKHQRIYVMRSLSFPLPIDTLMNEWENNVNLGRGMEVKVGGCQSLYLKDYENVLTSMDSTWFYHLDRTGQMIYEGVYLYIKDKRLICNKRTDSLFLFKYSPKVTLKNTSY